MSSIQEIELSIEEAKEKISRRDAALKLSGNREFKKLILDGYFKEEASRLVSLMGDPAAKDYRDDIIMDAQAISSFQQYMRLIVQMGNIAEAELKAHQEILDDERAMDEEVDI